ncbi:MAG: 3-hydroxyanthranilate 3,4-dioxygenase [Elusimicrobia bacterium]|nr:3-hydroxyanthranilate 3,4-dioxygenase [Elusimicrobiota bacterium]
MPTTKLAPPLNLQGWIEEHRNLLKPPVGNAQVWKDREFIVMVIGGPNTRTDFHIDPAEEFFYQVEGDIVLKVFEEDKIVDVPIRQGEMFLLPAFVPHSPRRPANTVGLVIERQRRTSEPDDRLRWYCESCMAVIHEASFTLTDITTQIKAILEQYHSDEALRTCKKCGAVAAVPQAR